MQPYTLDLDDLGQIFRRSHATMRQRLKQWMADENFPVPLPGHKPKLWSAAQVKAWVDAPDHAARLGLTFGHARDGETPAEVVAAVRGRLEARYGRVA